MQQSTDSDSSTATFASLLAALAAPEPAAPPAWDADLADDVTTLSYESALRAHSRYKPSPEPFVPSPEPAPEPVASAPIQASTPIHSTAFSQPLVSPKCASITIRMTAEECEQLRKRSAEAGMTVSAYLRSCTFEAEALRAQVREAVAALRAATSVSAAPEPEPEPRRHWSLRALLLKLFPQAQPMQHPARA